MGLIDRTLGTRIGDMTKNGGLAAAFDGTTNQAKAASAAKPATTQAFIGKDWGAGVTKTVTGFIAYGSNDAGFEGEGAELTITITLQGSTDNFSASIVDLGASAGTTNANSLIISVLSGITTTTAYRYHRLKIDAPTNTKEIFCAECQFFEADPPFVADQRLPGSSPQLTSPLRGRVAQFFQPLAPYTPVNATRDFAAQSRSVRPRPGPPGRVTSFMRLMKAYTPVTVERDFPEQDRSVPQRLPNRGVVRSAFAHRAPYTPITPPTDWAALEHSIPLYTRSGVSRQSFQVLAPYTPVTTAKDWFALEHSIANARARVGRLATFFIATPAYTPVTTARDWFAHEHSIPPPRLVPIGRARGPDIFLAMAAPPAADTRFADAGAKRHPRVRPLAGRAVSFYPGPIIVAAPPGTTVRTLALTGVGT